MKKTKYFGSLACLRLIILIGVFVVHSNELKGAENTSYNQSNDALVEGVVSRKVAVKDIPQTHLNDKQFILKLLKRTIKEGKVGVVEIYQLIPQSYQEDPEIAEIIFRQNSGHFKYFHPRLKSDEDFVLKLVEIDPYLLSLDFDLKKSRSFQERIKQMLMLGAIPLFDPNMQHLLLGGEMPSVKGYKYKTIEYLNLVYFSEFVHDDGKSLNLKLRDGSYKKFERILGEKTGHGIAHYEVPRFWGYLQGFGFYIISMAFYEGWHVYLVDDRTGEIAAQIHDYPRFSPSGKYIIYAKSVDAYNFSGIEIFSVEPYKVKSVFKESLYGFDFHSWIGDDSFQMSGIFTSEKAGYKQKGYMKVINDGGSWVMMKSEGLSYNQSEDALVEAIASRKISVKYIPQKYFNDKQFILKLLKRTIKEGKVGVVEIYQLIPQPYQEDPEIAEIVFRQNSGN